LALATVRIGHGQPPASAYRLICDPPSAVNRHGWVLCTEGAHTALDTTYLTISSAVIGSLCSQHIAVRFGRAGAKVRTRRTFGRGTGWTPYPETERAPGLAQFAPDLRVGDLG
jgi:hypothetical protein